jgi:hypothetical protein
LDILPSLICRHPLDEVYSSDDVAPLIATSELDRAVSRAVEM